MNIGGCGNQVRIRRPMSAVLYRLLWDRQAGGLENRSHIPKSVGMGS
jgi:hypothetical protein